MTTTDKTKPVTWTDYSVDWIDADGDATHGDTWPPGLVPARGTSPAPPLPGETSAAYEERTGHRTVEHAMTETTQMILPLECDEDGDIRDAAGDVIATVRWPSPDEYDLMMARGASIVRAVNAHEQLLAACKAAEELLANTSWRDHQWGHDGTLANLRAAIAAAE